MTREPGLSLARQPPKIASDDPDGGVSLPVPAQASA